MKRIDVAVAVIVGILAGASLAAGLMVHRNLDGVWVDCREAEIRDVPVEMREWCRRHRKGGRAN